MRAPGEDPRRDHQGAEGTRVSKQQIRLRRLLAVWISALPVFACLLILGYEWALLPFYFLIGTLIFMLWIDTLKKLWED